VVAAVLQAGQIEEVGPGVLRVVAPNPGPMTLDGTNTYVIAAPAGPGPALVVDPGPPGGGHAERVLGAVGGRDVAAVLLTHMHSDHSEGAWTLAETLGAPVLRAADGTLSDGLKLVLGLRVIATPGHTADSICLAADDGAVFTGDTILGRGTSVVAHPDGALGPYLASLEVLRALGPRPVLPGHGPALPDLAAVAAAYLAHRQERLAAVRAAVAAGATTARDVVEIVYVDVDPALWPAAELSVAAQLDWLREQG